MKPVEGFPARAPRGTILKTLRIHIAQATWVTTGMVLWLRCLHIVSLSRRNIYSGPGELLRANGHVLSGSLGY